MIESERKPPEVWYRASVKNAFLFALMWLGQAFLVVMFFKWTLHGSASFYWWMVPLSLLGAIMLFRPQWILRFERASQKIDQDAGALYEKRLPPGFP